MLALLILMLTYFWLILGGVELFKWLNRPREQHRAKPLRRLKPGVVVHLHR